MSSDVGVSHRLELQYQLPKVSKAVTPAAASLGGTWPRRLV